MPSKTVVSGGVETALNQLAKIVASNEGTIAPRRIVISDAHPTKHIRINKKVISIHTKTVADADLLELVKRCIALEVEFTSVTTRFIMESIKDYRRDAERAIAYLSQADPKFESWMKEQISTVLKNRMNKNGLA